MPVNFPKSLIWVTLDTFFLNLEEAVLPFLLHRAPVIPTLVEKEASFSPFFWENPRLTILLVWLRALVVSKKEKKMFLGASVQNRSWN